MFSLGLDSLPHYIAALAIAIASHRGKFTKQHCGRFSTTPAGC